MSSEPALDPAQVLADLAWLVKVDGDLGVRRLGGEQVVRVTVDLAPDTVIVGKQVIDDADPLRAVGQALAACRDQTEQHQRRSAVRLVREVTS